jgi:protein-tyrosine-phosphatase
MPLHSLKRIIWAFALGLVVFYTPYAGLAKAVTAGLVPGVPMGLVGLEILPAAILGTILTIPLIITLLGWWKYASIRRFAGIPIPVTTPAITLSGFGLALIIGSTTIAFTFKGISIVLALLLMRGGLLIMGPVIDAVFGRRVRWFSWAALCVSFAALLVSFVAASDHSLPLLALLNLAAYLTGYALRTPCMTKFAKVKDTDVTLRYFVQEVLVTIVLLPAIPAAMVLFGVGPVSLALRRGFTTFWTMHPAAIVPVVLIGVFYACHNLFGTLIYLDGRENTFCIPLFCGASFLAGFSAVFLLSRFFAMQSPPVSQLISSGMILSALALLSPLHHRMEDAWAFVTGRRLRSASLVTGPRLMLFVCSGNTCRSPMAAAISNFEIALRLGLPLDVVLRGNVRAESGGLTPRIGSPMTEESGTALRGLAIAAPPHEARPVTPEQIAAADAIYCMTESQRLMLIGQYPDAAAKVHCLDPAGDIADPIGHGPDVYADVARRIQSLVRMRFDQMGLPAIAIAVPS